MEKPFKVACRLSSPDAIARMGDFREGGRDGRGITREMERASRLVKGNLIVGLVKGGGGWWEVMPDGAVGGFMVKIVVIIRAFCKRMEERTKYWC